MKQIVVLSGKGGTGKTFVSANLALQFDEIVAVDADVDAANLNILLAGEIQRQELFHAGKEAYIEQDLCTGCGLCREKCPFDAVEYKENTWRINHLVCEGCTICRDSCPAGAVFLSDKVSGRWYESAFGAGRQLFHAELFPGQDNSGKLVTVLRQQAERYAEKNGRELIIIDGPPGIACPAMAALTNTDLTVLVTEPTPTAIDDLKRLIGLADSFRLKEAVVINKAGINAEREEEIRNICRTSNIPVLVSIPFSANVPLSLRKPGAYTEQYNDNISKALRSLYNALQKEIAEL
ncbi:MAG: 4Fe-4S binding protein [Spirochaetales bacterium]|nr:4Fe-4S binding protein [Spirochaetales bacterium]